MYIYGACYTESILQTIQRWKGIKSQTEKTSLLAEISDPGSSFVDLLQTFRTQTQATKNIFPSILQLRIQGQKHSSITISSILPMSWWTWGSAAPPPPPTHAVKMMNTGQNTLLEKQSLDYKHGVTTKTTTPTSSAVKVYPRGSSCKKSLHYDGLRPRKRTIAVSTVNQ